MYADDQLLAISGLQHLAFCKRQCALIHLEQAWAENFHTAEGRLMHERVHSNESETRGNVRTVRGMHLVSRRLGLVGVADVVEFHRDEASSLKLPRQSGTWRIYPVEYKRGKKKKSNFDEVQLCAQALCLEEMFDVSIPEGSLFYGQTRNRDNVAFDQKIRRQTEQLSEEFHTLMQSGVMPPATYGTYCKSCSLQDDCLPTVSKSASSYLTRMIDQSLMAEGSEP